MKSKPPLIGLPTRPPIPLKIPVKPPMNPLVLAPRYGSYTMPPIPLKTPPIKLLVPIPTPNTTLLAHKLYFGGNGHLEALINA